MSGRELELVQSKGWRHLRTQIDQLLERLGCFDETGEWLDTPEADSYRELAHTIYRSADAMASSKQHARAEAEAQRVTELEAVLKAAQANLQAADEASSISSALMRQYFWMALDSISAALAQAPAPATEQPGGEDGK